MIHWHGCFLGLVFLMMEGYDGREKIMQMVTVAPFLKYKDKRDKGFVIFGDSVTSSYGWVGHGIPTLISWQTRHVETTSVCGFRLMEEFLYATLRNGYIQEKQKLSHEWQKFKFHQKFLEKRNTLIISQLHYGCIVSIFLVKKGQEFRNRYTTLFFAWLKIDLLTYFGMIHKEESLLKGQSSWCDMSIVK